MGVGFEEGVIDLFYAGVGFEEFGDFEGGLVLLCDAEGEGFQASQEQVAAVRVDSSAHRLVEVSYFFDEFLSAEDDSGEDVIVAGEVFGAALEDDVHSELNGALVKWGGEGAVDEREDVVAVGDFFYFDEVEDVEVWVCGGFGEDEAGVFPDGAFELAVVAEWDDGAADGELL